MKKRIVSLLLVVVMVVSMMPAMSLTAFAATEITYIDENGTEKKTTSYTTLTTSVSQYQGTYYLTGTRSISGGTLAGNTVFIVAGDANYTFNSGITGSSYNLSIYNVKGSTSGTITINGTAGSAGNKGANGSSSLGGEYNAKSGDSGSSGGAALSVYNLNLSNVTLNCTGGNGGNGGNGGVGATGMGSLVGTSGAGGKGGAGANAVTIGSGLTVYGGTLTATGGRGGNGGTGGTGAKGEISGFSAGDGGNGGTGGSGGNAISVLGTLNILHGGTLNATGGQGGRGGNGGTGGQGSTNKTGGDGGAGKTGGSGGFAIVGDSSHTVSISLNSNSVLNATSGNGGNGGTGGDGGSVTGSYGYGGTGGTGGTGGSSPNGINYATINVVAGLVIPQSGSQGAGIGGGNGGSAGHAGSKGTDGFAGSRGYAIGGLTNNFNALPEHRGGESSLSLSTWDSSNISTYRYIYASKWICTVTFDQKGGTGGTETVDLAYGDTMSAITAPTKVGYTLKGYYDAETGGNKYYDADGTSVTTTWNYNIKEKKLYAQWTPHTYTIKFNTKGGSGTFADISATYDEEYTLSSAEPTLDKCKFVGWNTKEDFTGDSYAAGAKVKNLSATDNDTVILYAQLIHAHGLWTYGATDNVITGTCGVTDCNLEKSKISLTLSAVDSTYNGLAYTGASTNDETVKFAETTEAAIGDFVYYLADGTTKTTPENSGAAEEGAAPVYAGSYTAKVTVTYNTDQTVTAAKQFKIEKKAPAKDDLTVTLPSASDITYDGQGHAATAELKTATSPDPQLTGLGTVTMKYQKKTGETTWGTATTDAPKDVGTYKVLVSTVAGDNFKATEADIDVEKTITIVPKEVTLNWQPASGEGAIDLVYSGKEKVPTVTATGLVDGESVKVDASVTAENDNKNIGSFTFTATGLSKAEGNDAKPENYKLPNIKVSDSYTITPFTTTLENVSSSANYDGQGHTITFSPKSPEGGDDPLQQSDFTVKYYKVDEDLGTIGGELSKATSIGKYIYVADLTTSHGGNYKLDPNTTLTGKPGSLAAIEGKTNAGIFSITVTVPTMQKPISFQSGLVNKLVTDSTFTNALSNDNAGAKTTYSSSNSAVATVATDGTVTIKGAGSTTITAQSHVEGMTDVYAAYTLVVSKKEITVTVKDKSIKYGDASPYTTEATLSDVLTFSETPASGTNTTPTFTTSYVVGKSVGEYLVRVSLPTSAKYSYVYESGTLTVEPKTLTADDFTVVAANKTYDGNVTATVTATVKSDSLVSTDALTVTAVGSFNSAAVGTGKTVSYEITGIYGAKANNYVLGTVESTTTADITKATISFAFGESEFTYDGNKKAVSVTASGGNCTSVKYKGDGTTSYTESTIAPTGAGTYTVTANYDTTNYELSGSNTTTLTIKKANVTVWATGGTTHLFGDADKSVSVMSIPNLAMDVTYYSVDAQDKVGSSVTPSAVGKYLYVITLADNDKNKNYEIGGALSGAPTGIALNALVGSNFGVMTIGNSAQQALSFANAQVSKLTTDSAFKNTLTNPNTGATVTYTSSKTSVATVNDTTGEVTIVGVGNATITAKSALTGYTEAYASYTLNVTKEEVTVTVSDKSVTYGDANPYTDGNKSGITFSKTIADSDVTVTGLKYSGYTQGKSVGEYAIRASGLTSDKYSFVYEPGTLTVNPKTLTAANFTVTAKEKVYDGNTTAVVSAVTKGLVGSDTLTVTAVGSFANANVGTGKTVSYEITGISGVKANNYAIGTVKGTVNADITKSPVTFTIGATEFAYDGNPKPVAISAEDTNGRSFAAFTVMYGESTEPPSNVGTYAISVTLKDATNYMIANSGDVTGKKLTIKSTGVVVWANSGTEHVYDGTGKTIEPMSVPKAKLKVMYYTVKDDGTVGDVVEAPSALGRYLYVISLAEDEGNKNYTIEDALEGTPTGYADTVAATSGSDVGIMTIGENAQKSIYFEDMLVNKQTTGKAFTITPKNTDANATVTYSSSNETVATVNPSTGEVTIVGAGSATIKATSKLTGYMDTSAVYTLVVGKEEITVTVKDKKVTYGGDSPYDTLDDLTFSKEDIVTTGLTPTFSTSYAKGKNVNEYPVRVTLPASEKYTFVYVPGTLTVEPKELTADDFTVTAADKTFDGTSSVVLTAEANSASLINGDKLGVTVQGSFENVDAGENKTVNYTITGISGPKAVNYLLDETKMSGTAKATVGKAPVTFTIGETSFLYDGNKKPVTVTAKKADGIGFTGFLVKYNGDTKAPSKVGEYPIAVEITDPNYDFASSVTGHTLKIEKMPIRFTFGTTEFAYDGQKKTVAVSAENANGGVFTDFLVYYEGQGDTVYTESTTAPSEYGTYTVTAKYAEEDYRLADETVNTETMTITRGSVTVWVNAGLTHLYNDPDKTITAMSAPNLPLTVTYYTVDSDGIVGEIVTPDGLGKYLYVITLTDNESYFISDAMTEDPVGKNVSALTGTNIGVMTISNDAQPSLVAANPVMTRVYGDAPFSQKISGGAPGATLHYSIPNESEKQYASIDADTGVITILKPGTVIVEARATKAGYADAVVRYAVLIEKRPVKITLGETVQYNGKVQIAPYTVTNDVEGNRIESEDIRFVYQNQSNTGAAGTFRNAGKYYVTADIPSSNEYYSFMGVTGFVNITKAPLTVTADNKTVVYGSAIPEYTVTCTGLLESDTVFDLDGRAVFNCQYDPFSWVGQYPVTVGGLKAVNYDIRFVSGKVTVVPRPVHLLWIGENAQYDGRTKKVEAIVANVVNGDYVKVTGYEGTTSASEADTYELRATSLNDPNYTLVDGTNLTKTWAIEKLNAKVKPADAVVYVGSSYSLRLNTSELMRGDAGYTGTPSFRLTKEDGSAISLEEALNTVGNYTITWTNPDEITFSTNYEITIVTTGTLTVCPEQDEMYEVKLGETENGAVIANCGYAFEGRKVILTVVPEEGYELESIQVAKKNGKAVTVKAVDDTTYTFKMPDADVTVSAVFKAKEKEEWLSKRFTDLKPDQWYSEGIAYCVEKGLMNGVSDTEFDPNGTTTRAMVVTLLWRMENSPVVNGAMSFKDVPANQWYTEAIRWANSTGLVKGYDTNTFGTTDKITREQLATILYRYAFMKGADVKAKANLSGYSDFGQVSDYAVDALKWAVAEGLVNGRTSTTLVPTGNATRAEAACLIYRFCELLAK